MKVSVRMNRAVQLLNAMLEKTAMRPHQIGLLALIGVLEHAHARAIENEATVAWNSADSSSEPELSPPVEVVVAEADEVRIAIDAALKQIAQESGELHALLTEVMEVGAASQGDGVVDGVGPDGAVAIPARVVVAQADPVAVSGLDGDGVITQSAVDGSTGASNQSLVGWGLMGLVAATGAAGIRSASTTNTSSGNMAPTAIDLSASAVVENVAGAVIGKLNVTDLNAADAHIYRVDDDRFEVVDGQLKLKAGVSLDHEVGAAVNVSVTATDAGGLSTTQIFSIRIADVIETTVLTGTDAADVLSHASGLDDFVITALSGNDQIATNDGNDIIRPGEGADTVNAGAGNDIVVVVGRTAANQYTQSDITNPGGTGIDLSRVLTLAELNGRTVSEIQPGEVIDGGAGVNRLVIYGDADLTGVTLANLAQFQVNSDVTVTAQQLNGLPVRLMFGDGESILNINNAGSDPVVVDFSNVRLTDFRTLNIGAGVTLIVDQADVDSLQYIAGDGVLRASSASGTLNLTGKYLTIGVQDKDGNVWSGHGGTEVNGDLLIGGETNENLTGGSQSDRIEGGSGDDILVGNEGNDILRGGAGVDSVDGGAGNDRFVIVGDLSGGGKVDSVADTDVLGFPLTGLNGKDLDEDKNGAAETLVGGEGDDTLYVYGTADLSSANISGIEHVEIRSDVKFDAAFFASNVVKTVSGDGSSILRLQSATPIELDLSDIGAFKISGIGQISLGANVTLKISSLDQLGGARILTGDGTIKAAGATSLQLPSTYSIQDKLNFVGIDTAAAEKLAQVVTKENGVLQDTAGNDYMPGTEYADTFRSTLGGDDVISGKKGSDTYYIAGSGKKIILDVSAEDNGGDVDTLNLSEATGPANINLSTGGTVGSATVQLGSGSSSGGTQRDAQKVNLMLILDVSGSMSGTRLTQAKQAAEQLFDAYDNLGDVAVRIVTFSSGANSTFNGYDGWVDLTTARGIVNGLVASGSTNYSAAMTLAMEAHGKGRDGVYFENGADVSFFLSDGQPNSSVYARENEWEDFLIQNQIISNALGFGGLSNTTALEPVAFDGTRVKSSGDDHGPGEIRAILTLDVLELGDTLISQAKLDFVERLEGTGFGDNLIGNQLNNNILGGGGNDSLSGMGGDDVLVGGAGADVGIFRGKFSDYSVTISPSGDVVLVDGVNGRDGVTKTESIETFRFLDPSGGGTVDLDRKDVLPVYQNDFPGTANAAFLEAGGIFTFMGLLASAAYTHTGVGDEVVGLTGDLPKNSLFHFLNNEEIKNNSSFRYLSADEIGISSGRELAFYLEDAVNFNSTMYFEYEYSDGFYGTDRVLSPSSSFATVGRTSDALFLTFRGTDLSETTLTWDWIDDLVGMRQHYAQYVPLFKAIDDYINDPSNEVKSVYVGGHSLGGQMANLYMYDHRDDERFRAITFAAANKFNEDAYGNKMPITIPRSLNVETPGDPVPDLLGSSGISLQLNYGNTNDFDHLTVGGLLSGFGQHSLVEYVDYFDVLDNYDFNGIDLEGAAFDFFEGNTSLYDRAALVVDDRILELINKVGYAALIAQIDDGGSISPAVLALLLASVALSPSASSELLINLNEAADDSWLNFIKDIKILGDETLIVGGDVGIYDFNPLNNILDVKNIIISPSAVLSDASIGIVGGGASESGFGNSGGNLMDFHGSSVSSGVILIGAAGKDSLIGSSGDDILFGDDHDIYNLNYENSLKILDNITFLSRREVDAGVFSSLTRLPFGASDFDYVDSLQGGSGDDVIAGGRGDDIMMGGDGNDVYFIESSGDVVVEQYSAGNDVAVLYSRFGHFNYALPDNVEVVVIGDDKWSLSENMNVVAEVGSKVDHIIIGNSGNNKIVGGDGDDIIVGGADKDYIFGGGGDDVLFGGVYADFKSVSGRSASSALVDDIIKKYSYGGAIDGSDVSYLRGGAGRDHIYGSILDNDFFLIDVNLGNNFNNVDKIVDFYIAHALSDPSAEDYLVFSAQQLGIAVGDVDEVGSSGIFVNGEIAHHVSMLNFEDIEGISNYKVGFAANNKPQFLLDTADGGLWFDQDGSHDVGDQVLLAYLGAAGYGWATDLGKFDADQILIMDGARFELV